MSLRAIAFHESFNLSEITAHLGTYGSICFTPPSSVVCLRCGARFLAFFAMGKAGDDFKYLGALQRRITENCSRGAHPNKRIEESVDP